ncbi:hypothetical protein DSO57_1000338 [Entomophthora muscae]|uniref:Uncharacterized protein n=1 Tax=Entomophthora muscae TaxID=34485 RepID=A0ACC2TK01_9FUNG|nr:hypothetical protein DSO57_1000338 [Entomophthora muscae]
MSNGPNDKQAADASSLLLGVLNDKPTLPKSDSSSMLLSLLNQPPAQAPQPEFPALSSSKSQAKSPSDVDVKALLFPSVTPYSDNEKKKPKAQRKISKRADLDDDSRPGTPNFVVSSSLVINEMNNTGTNFSHVSPFDQIPDDLDNFTATANKEPSINKKSGDRVEPSSGCPGFRLSGNYLSLGPKPFSVATPLGKIFQ